MSKKWQLKVFIFRNQVFYQDGMLMFQMTQGGIHAKLLFLEIRLLWYLKDTFAKLWFLTTSAAPCINILHGNVICKNEVLPKKITDFFRYGILKSLISLSLFLYKNYVFKLILKNNTFLYVFLYISCYLTFKYPHFGGIAPWHIFSRDVVVIYVTCVCVCHAFWSYNFVYNI